VQQIQTVLLDFHARLEKYCVSLSPGGSGNRLKDAARKIQFKLNDKDIEKVRDDVAAYAVALKMILQTMTL
jgi:hypothetical protein